MEELLALCKKGDRRAQKKLYDSLAPKMFALCIRYMGDRESAADVLQDGFVTLFSKLDTFSGEGSFEGWVRRIFVNTALMSLRKNDILRNTKELEDAAPVVSEASSALDDIGYKELMAMVASLPTGFRTVFNMYVIEGFSHKDIADALGISEATSRSQLLRGRTMLQDMIRKRR
ncbi:MAG: RNA polymerase sigma factor [Bacteroidales bacterium]|nr:RNA polymerase sigma factor [Bacteroidales bacterium]